jgi:ABC-type nitrate/sulfonate/bicarbonate transport system permease component
MNTAVSEATQVNLPAPPSRKPSLGRRLRNTTGRWLPPLVFAVTFLAIWQLYATVSGVPESSLPSPTEILQAMVDNRALLAENAWVTIQEIALGYLAAIILGVGLAVLICSSKMIERAVYPWLVVSQMVPIVAIAPIIVIWTGFDIRPKIIVIALVSFFPIAVNTIDGLKAADPEMDNLLKTLGAGRWKRFRTADFPAALPFIFSGLRVGAALSVIGAVFAEWVGSSAGLGYLILSFNNQTATAEMFGAVIVLALIGLALFGAVGLVQKITIPWYHDARFEDPDVEPEGL